MNTKYHGCHSAGSVPQGFGGEASRFGGSPALMKVGLWKHFGGALLVLLGCSALAVPAFAEDCITGSISAEMETTGPYTGLYKYTVEVSWLSEQGLSHVSLDFGLGQCPAIACASTWFFPEPAGANGRDGDNRPAIQRGGGTDGDDEESGECQVHFRGEFNCKSDPSTGSTDPVLKWDALDGGPCEAENTGSATLFFYTDIPPSYGQSPTVMNKNGRNVCSGKLTGAVPVVCAVNTEPAGWGQLKLTFSSE